jgi:hypothetical protein
MLHFGTTRLGWLCLAMACLPAAAQEAGKGAPPPTACPADLAAIATCYADRHDSGAYLLAAMPKNWNGRLIVFAHGGPSLVPPTPTGSQSDLAKYGVAIKLGYAWVA